MPETAQKNAEKTTEKAVETASVAVPWLKVQEILMLHSKQTKAELLEKMAEAGMPICRTSLIKYLNGIKATPPPGFWLRERMVRVGKRKVMATGYELVSVKK